jgi:hypothetical protein
MAKGQQRSNREAKKPKKAVAEKAKPSAVSGISDPTKSAGARRPDKR